ncbi:MAG: ABC transporter permease, partial [Methanomassiliicoccales archaeon]
EVQLVRVNVVERPPEEEEIGMTPLELESDLVVEILRQKGKKVAIIGDSGGFGKDGVAVFKENLSKYGMTLDLAKYFLVGVSLFLALMSALALCMILGIFTKNYKAAQSMTMPITFLALIPMFVLMMTDFNTLPTAIQVVIFAIPFSEPMMAMKSLMFNDYGIVVAGIIYQAFFAGVAMLVAVKLFRKDILLTGKVKSAGAKRSFVNFGFNKRR